VTRIIAGSAGGRTIKVPVRGTRPTSDRVRESLFSALDSALLGLGRDWSDCAVLDLYAGSGALGLEALSRGARSAVLVEKSRAAVSIIEGNVRTLGFDGAGVVCADAREYCMRPGEPIDVCLVDPPYDVPADDLSAMLTLLSPRLGPESILVVERPSSDPSSPLPEGWSAHTRRMGDTVLWYGRAD